METQPLIPGRRKVYRKKSRYGNVVTRFIVFAVIGILFINSISLVKKLRLFGDYFPLDSRRISRDKLFDLYLKQLKEQNFAGDWLKKYTSIPHLAGEGYELVEFTEKKFQEYGLKTHISTYDVYLNTPKDHALNLIDTSSHSIVYSPSLREDELKDDPTTQGDDLIPTFHGYSANGNVTAEFIYANYGRKQDFAKLVLAGVDIKGKICIVRYGEIYRGLKVRFAQENGAVAVLMYSDPADDHGITVENGYKLYPEGPARNPSSVQRGSVMYLSDVPGDPTTPGYASVPGAERADPHHSTPKIPSLPISYKEVLPILEKLNGYGLDSGKVDEDFAGELPGISYNIGPNPGYTLNLFNEQNYNITPIFNVIGELEGHLKDEVIVIGNHRDSWIVGGASDPNSGSASMLEIIRGFSALIKLGYKPLRTIVFASWDGEELGLLGSTEYVEDNLKFLQKKVVAYLNLDSSVSGTHLGLDASPSLFNLLKECSKLVDYPQGGTLFDHYAKERNWDISIMGSGSDYCPFLDHATIPSLNLGFSSSSSDAVYHYHSNYDSFHWMSTLVDPDFVYHNAISQYLGLMILQLSEKEILDLKIDDYSKEIRKYFKEVLELIPKEWSGKKIYQFDLSNDLDYHKFVKKITDVYKSFDISKVKSKLIGLIDKLRGKDLVHGLSHSDDKHHPSSELTLKDLVSMVSEELDNFNTKMVRYNKFLEKLQSKLSAEDLSLWQKLKLLTLIKLNNARLKFFERNFLHVDGLKDRPWYKHMIYASGRYTGYAGQSLPGIREAVEDGDFEATVDWINYLYKSIKRIEITLTDFTY